MGGRLSTSCRPWPDPPLVTRAKTTVAEHTQHSRTMVPRTPSTEWLGKGGRRKRDPPRRRRRQRACRVRAGVGRRALAGSPLFVTLVSGASLTKQSCPARSLAAGRCTVDTLQHPHVRKAAPRLGPVTLHARRVFPSGRLARPVFGALPCRTSRHPSKRRVTQRPTARSLLDCLSSFVTSVANFQDLSVHVRMQGRQTRLL